MHVYLEYFSRVRHIIVYKLYFFSFNLRCNFTNFFFQYHYFFSFPFLEQETIKSKLKIPFLLWAFRALTTILLLLLHQGIVFGTPWTIVARLLCPWNFPGKNTVVSCHFLLQGIFLTQGLNPHLLPLLLWQVGSLPLLYLGSPSTKEWL